MAHSPCSCPSHVNIAECPTTMTVIASVLQTGTSCKANTSAAFHVGKITRSGPSATCSAYSCHTLSLLSAPATKIFSSYAEPLSCLISPELLRLYRLHISSLLFNDFPFVVQHHHQLLWLYRFSSFEGHLPRPQCSQSVRSCTHIPSGMVSSPCCCHTPYLPDCVASSMYAQLAEHVYHQSAR